MSLISVYALYFVFAIFTTTYDDTCHNKEEMRSESSLYNVCNELCVLFSKVIVHYLIRCVAQQNIILFVMTIDCN